MLSTEDLKNIVILVKAGAKTMDLDGNGLMVVGALIKKCEGMMKNVEVDIPPKSTGKAPQVYEDKKKKNP